MEAWNLVLAGKRYCRSRGEKLERWEAAGGLMAESRAVRSGVGGTPTAARSSLYWVECALRKGQGQGDSERLIDP